MGFFKKLGHSIGKIGRGIGKFVQKVAPTAGTLIGTVIGGPAGASIGGAIGGAVGSFGSGGMSSTVPEISAPVTSIGYQPTIGTPGFTGGALVYRDGTARNADGTMMYDKDLVNEVYGSPYSPHNGNNGSNIAPIVFGVGAVLLLSD